MKIIFFGTPDFAVPSLKLLKSSKHKILAVVTNPDIKSGRGKKNIQTNVKTIAKKINCKILQTKNLNNLEFIKTLKMLNADLFVVVAFKILPKILLGIPKKYCINLHPSLLPKYRGAAPIHHAILNGDNKTGISTFILNEKVDNGDILLQDEFILSHKITLGEAYSKLSEIGAKLLLKTVDMIDEKSIISKKQNNIFATKAPKIKKTDTYINWNDKSSKIHNQIRAFTPVPGAFTTFLNRRVKLYNSNPVVDDLSEKLSSGEFKYRDPFYHVGTGDGYLQIADVQLEGKHRMKVSQFIKGYSKYIEGTFK